MRLTEKKTRGSMLALQIFCRRLLDVHKNGLENPHKHGNNIKSNKTKKEKEETQILCIERVCRLVIWGMTGYEMQALPSLST